MSKYDPYLDADRFNKKPVSIIRNVITDAQIRRMDIDELKILSREAERYQDGNLLIRANDALQQVRRETDPMKVSSSNMMGNGQSVTWGNDGFISLSKIVKPTQKVGDLVKATQDALSVKSDNIKTSDNPRVLKGAVGKVSKVGSQYVYVDFKDLEGVKFSPKFLTSTTDPITYIDGMVSKELDLSRVIMPEEHRDAIKEAVAQLEYNDKIFKDWGFDEVLEKGKAISLLFYGVPGTGKTMCAEMIATSLGKELQVIGTGEIQSSEPGQAERNIKAYFEQGKDKVLLFDECDSLVHSRNNTGSIMAAQINALLTSLEQFEGIVIFTTNRLGVLDEAFNRRLSLKLEFPVPNKEERLQIWKGMFPLKAPLDKDIQWDKLANLELTGGYIKNIVLRAARSAAVQGLESINHEVLKKATIHEVKSKREFEAAASQYRRRGVTTVDEAIQDFGNNTLTRESLDDSTRKSTRARKDSKV